MKTLQRHFIVGAVDCGPLFGMYHLSYPHAWLLLCFWSLCCSKPVSLPLFCTHGSLHLFIFASWTVDLSEDENKVNQPILEELSATAYWKFGGSRLPGFMKEWSASVSHTCQITPDKQWSCFTVVQAPYWYTSPFRAGLSRFSPWGDPRGKQHLPGRTEILAGMQLPEDGSGWTLPT